MQIESHFPGGQAAEGLAHRKRCKTLPPLLADEAEHLMAAFLATRDATICPAGYAAPTEHASQPMPRGL